MGDEGAIGVVLMHGKGGSPSGWVADLAGALERQGVLVANIEMPWSGRRDYDVGVAAAENEIVLAMEELRRKGAGKLFVAGHSQGGRFALYFGSRQLCNGIIAIAPGGEVDAPNARKWFGEDLERARSLVAEGRGGEKLRFSDHEGSKGSYPIVTTPQAYAEWFDPEGAMSSLALRQFNPAIPVLWISPSRDYLSLLKSAEKNYASLPPNPLSRFWRPDADHKGAPAASAAEIGRWMRAVVDAAH
jgi:pimeloyl-ACP methyl ester carboxylesterase